MLSDLKYILVGCQKHPYPRVSLDKTRNGYEINIENDTLG